MKRKINSEAGFTLVEMLAAVVILVMLSLMLGTGLQMTMDSYQKITAQSEVDLLASTAVNALADDLRFARDVSGKTIDTTKQADGYKDCSNFNYTSDSFAGKELRIGLNGAGQIVVCENNGAGPAVREFLSSGAYGVMGADGKRAYKVAEEGTNITYNDNDGIFTIRLTVQAVADPSIEATREVTVRCLNQK